jgi:hypothetical protein
MKVVSIAIILYMVSICVVNLFGNTSDTIYDEVISSVYYFMNSLCIIGMSFYIHKSARKCYRPILKSVMIIAGLDMIFEIGCLFSKKSWLYNNNMYIWSIISAIVILSLLIYIRLWLTTLKRTG